MKLLLPHLYPGATMGLAPLYHHPHHVVQEVHSRPLAAPQLGSCISVHLSLDCRPVTLASRLNWLDFITTSFFWKLLVPNSLDLCEHEPALLWGEPAWWCQCLLRRSCPAPPHSGAERHRGSSSRLGRGSCGYQGLRTWNLVFNPWV